MNQDQTDKIEGTAEAWENGELGRDEQYVRVADIDENAVDDSLELQQISIRLQKSLIEDFKLIARINGIGYQPLMRQILTRFADCEKKKIMKELAAKVQTEAEEVKAAGIAEDSRKKAG